MLECQARNCSVGSCAVLELYRLLNLERVEWQPGSLADLRAVQIGLPTEDQLSPLRAVSFLSSASVSQFPRV